MKIQGTGNAPFSMNGQNPAQGTDAVAQEIRAQINEKQQALSDLAKNELLSPEEKRKKQQELRQEITELNRELRQHEIAQRKEERQERQGTSTEELTGGTPRGKHGRKASGLSAETQTALISADVAQGQAAAQGNVRTRLEGHAGVLESEIKQDQALGGDTEKKEKELAETNQKVNDLTKSELETLSTAAKAAQEAGEAEDADEETSEDEEYGKEDTDHGNDTGLYVDERV